MQEEEISWVITHEKLFEPVIVPLSEDHRFTGDDPTEISRTTREIEATSDSVLVWEGHSVPYRQVVEIRPFGKQSHLVSVKRTFSNQPDGFEFSEINDTFLVKPSRKTDLLDARLFYREVLRRDGCKWVEEGEVRINWFGLAAYALAIFSLLGLLAWAVIWLVF